MYGTCSSRGTSAVADLGGIPIDYLRLDFVKEILPLTNDGVDAVFDGIDGTHIWRSRKALRPGGSWPMALLPRYVRGDWLQVVQVVAIGFVESPSSASTLPLVGFSLAVSGLFRTASSGSSD
jgi:NADPH:quinone reductase-like Zn-dependent oxidoreductase